MNAWKTTAVAVVAFVLVFFGGARTTDRGYSPPSLGSKTVTKYVAIGNSLTAGYQSNGLYQSGADLRYPNLIAGQLKLAGATLGTFGGSRSIPTRGRRVRTARHRGTRSSASWVPSSVRGTRTGIGP